MKTPKIEWSALLICALVFGFTGFLFTAMGAIFGITIEELAASPNSHGNVYILPWIFCTLGIVFLLVFAVLLFLLMKQRNTRKRLIENGYFLHACVTDIRQDVYVQINHRHPYYVICEGTEPYTGQKLTFKSADIPEDPSQLLGRYVRVFLDRKDPKTYYVELVHEHND